MKKSTSLLMLFLILSISFSQTLDLPVNIQSPIAASLGKYGDIPVSYFTGTPQISIPVYQLDVRNKALNISLDYDASGVRINRHPGWVGQNWSLECGGLITRTVVGQPDENSYVNTGYVPEEQGYFYHYNELNDGNVDDKDFLFSCAVNAAGFDDYEPDIFTFNFMGMTGKFFLDNDGEWKVLSSSNLKVIFDVNDLENNLITPINSYFEFVPGTYEQYTYPKVIKGFKMIDDIGTTYIFGYDNDPEQLNAIEYSIDFFRQLDDPSIWIANAWYLVKVIDNLGVELYNFEYSRESFTVDLYRSTRGRQWWWTDGPSWTGFWFIQGEDCEPGVMFGHDYSYFVDGNLILPSYLNKVTTYTGDVVDFSNTESIELNYSKSDISVKYTDLMNKYYDNELPDRPFYYTQVENEFTGTLDPYEIYHPFDITKCYKLDHIIIKNNQNKTTKRVEFNYNDKINQRLYLEEVKVYGNDHLGPDSYSYKLGYNKVDQLPTYLSKKIDHWGYYKGDEYIIGNLNSYYEERESNPSFLKIGMLEYIIYPTGGYTRFDYEPHNYSKIVSYDKSQLITESGIAGGVRIKKIVNNDGDGEITRNFKYKNNFSTGGNASSGILSVKPRYYWDAWTQKAYLGDLNFGIPTDSITFAEKVFSVNSIIPLSNSFGPHIGYSEVTELRNDGSYIVNKFTNYDNIMDSPPMYNFLTQYSRYDKFNNRGLQRGQLTKQVSYNSNNYKVSEIINSYRDDINDMEANYVLGTNVFTKPVCQQQTAAFILMGQSYKLFYFDYDVIEQVKRVYFDNESKFVETTTSFTKEDNNIATQFGTSNIRLTTQLDKEVNHSTLSELYYYPTDLISTENYMQDLVNDHRLNEVIKKESFRDNIPIGVNKKLYANVNDLILPSQTMKSHDDITSLEPDIIYDKYDETGIILQFHKNHDVNNSIYRGYNGQYPIAAVINASYEEAGYTGFENGESNGWIINDNKFAHSIDSKTGEWYYIVSPGDYFPQKEFIPEDQEGKYIFSAWVKSYLSSGLGGIGYQLEDDNNNIIPNTWHWTSFSTTDMEWKYMDLIIDLNEIRTNLGLTQDVKIRVFGHNAATSGFFYIDNLRFHPLDAQMTTYDFYPQIGVTAISDLNNLSNLFNYDQFCRLSLERDHKFDIRSKYNYNYSGTEQVFDLYDVEYKSSYTLGEIETFKPKIVGGSGNFSYDWSLKKGSAVLLTGSSETFTTQLTDPGYSNYYITCTVTDNQLNKTESVVKTFTVYDQQCYFENINESIYHPSTGATESTGNIKSPQNETITIRCVRPNPSGVVTYQIGDLAWVLPVETSSETRVVDYVDEPITCKIILEGEATYAFLEIVSIQNNNTQIGQPDKIEVTVSN